MPGKKVDNKESKRWRGSRNKNAGGINYSPLLIVLRNVLYSVGRIGLSLSIPIGILQIFFIDQHKYEYDVLACNTYG